MICLILSSPRNGAKNCWSNCTARHAPSDRYSRASGFQPNMKSNNNKVILRPSPPKRLVSYVSNFLTLISCATPLFTSKIVLYLTISPLHLVVEFLITTLWCGNHSSGQPSHSRAGGWRCWEYTTWALIPVVGATAPRDTI